MTRVVLHDAALADGTSSSLRTGMSLDPLSDPRALWRVWAVYQRGARVA